MKKTYFIIPTSNIWTDKAIVEKLRHAYTDKSVAIDDAEKMSRQYNEDFFVCGIETKVSTKRTLIDLK